MLSANEWDETPNIDFRNVVRQEAKDKLNTLQIGEILSTAQLVEAIYPKSQAIYVAQTTIRDRIFKTLMQLIMTDLKTYCTKGEINGEYMGMPKRPWLWHLPKLVLICEHCGQEYRA